MKDNSRFKSGQVKFALRFQDLNPEILTFKSEEFRHFARLRCVFWSIKCTLDAKRLFSSFSRLKMMPRFFRRLLEITKNFLKKSLSFADFDPNFGLKSRSGGRTAPAARPTSPEQRGRLLFHVLELPEISLNTLLTGHSRSDKQQPPFGASSWHQAVCIFSSFGRL